MRIETALKKLLTSVKQICENNSELVGRLASINDLALQTFILNVKPEIGLILRSRQTKTLNEAFNVAIEEEKIQSLMREQHNKNRSTYFQNKNPNYNNSSGAYPKYNNNNNNNNQNRSVKFVANDKKNSKGNNQSNFNGEKFCKYCKNNGHVIDECRKLKFKNSQRKGENQNNGNPNNDRAFPISNSDQGNESNPDVNAAAPRELESLAALSLE